MASWRLLPLLLTLALMLPAALRAQETGLLVGNARYDLAEPLRRGDAILDARDALRGAGLDLQVLEDADRDSLSTALRQLEQQGRRADGVLVALSGRFVSSRDESYFLPIEAQGASLIDTALSAVPLSAVMGLLSNAPGRAVLVLATDDRGTSSGLGLSPGIGRLDIPQGVTVIRATPTAARDILRDTLARPGAGISAGVEDAGGTVQGFAPGGLSFLPERASRTISIPPAQQGPSPAERDLWEQAQRADSEEGFIEYLMAYPGGAFVDRAEDRLDDIRNDPDRLARRAEDALGLSASERQAIQRDLVLLGYDTRGIDGVFGPGTRGAIRGWQGRDGRAVTGYLDRDQIAALDAQAATRAAELEEESRRRAELRAAAEEAYWAETGQGRSIDGLEAFLSRYPDGNFADEARRRLDDMRGAEADRAERQAWETARARDSAAGYADFLDRFPQGRFAETARNRLDQLRGQGAQANSEAEAAEAQLGLTSITRQAIEQRLAAEGLDPGRVDGQFDENTRRAIRRYQAQVSLPQTGYLNQITVVRLLADSVRRVLQ
ncbi:Putative peptidoglycan binding domain-containing protein [Palleronia salina]|uniref:Putative peptidoglycan binding domain-containing protein n=1 Tax=Palleronia salina TaxID=313368 RepID=A0A1M6KAA1_9RHOB|nr:peptidoglycan-binding protein [Palleronia salina]SHJ55862.1 Putative peptidoglycan binding domain-containing protein [Palleronia salina]